MSFEEELSRRMHAIGDVVVVPTSMQQRVVRTARRRRIAMATGGVMVLAALIAALSATPWAGTNQMSVLPPAGSSGMPQLATPVGSQPCGYGRVVRAEHPDLPSDASCAWGVTGDFDGDDRGDAVFSYGIGGDTDPSNRRWVESRWHLRVVFGSGGVSTTRFESPMKLGMPLVPRVIGTVDADGDADSEIFVASDVGNGATVVVYAVNEGSLVPVSEMSKGRPMVFEASLAASDSFISGVRCSNAEAIERSALIVTTVERSSAQELVVTETTLVWSSSTEVRRHPSQIETVSNDQQDRFEKVARLDCRGLSWAP